MKNDSLFSALSPETKRYLRIMVSVSQAIRKERQSLGLSQKDFARYMHVSQAMVSKWESGHYNFTLEKIVGIYDRLGLPLSFEEERAVPAQPSFEKYVKAITAKIIPVDPNAA